MCATLQERGESILLRSYIPPEDAKPVSKDGKNFFSSKFMEGITISEAARATSAAPTYFPEVKLPMEGDKRDVVFWDGGLLNNNPIDQVWRARLDLVDYNDKAPQVACVLSIGTSWSTVPAPSMLDAFIPKKSTGTGIGASIKNAAHRLGTWVKDTAYGMVEVLRPVEQMIPFLTNTEAKHLDFSRYMKRLEHRIAEFDAKTKYFRFNTPTPVYIDMSDSAKMSDLEKYTQKWLAEKDNAKYVDECAEILAKKVGPTK
jgi:patatin-like phospholipase/acyl hydrolase